MTARPYKITYLVPNRRADGRDSRVTSSFASATAARTRLAELESQRPGWDRGFSTGVHVLSKVGPASDPRWWEFRDWDGWVIVGLTTCQMAATGSDYALTPTPAQRSYDVHMVRVARAGGTPGPTLCGIDRFGDDAPGWSIGGGVSGERVRQIPCTGCTAAARSEYPGMAPSPSNVGGAEVLAVIGRAS